VERVVSARRGDEDGVRSTHRNERGEDNAVTRPQNLRPMQIRLEDERREQLIESLERFMTDEFDVVLSEFQAGRLLEFMVKRLGAPIYNQAIQDARGFVQDKLEDLEGEFYEPEDDD